MFASDFAGNLLEDAKQKYTYDGYGRSQKVETFAGEVQIHRYDAEGLWQEMGENGLLACAAEYAATYYHYASEERGSITHLLENTEVLNWYRYDAFWGTLEQEERVENRFQYAGSEVEATKNPIQTEGKGKTVKPEAGVTGSKKHGVKWKEGKARAKKEGKPQGQWHQDDLEYATEKANTLNPGESAEFDLPKGSKSIIHMPDGSTKPATKFWIRNNGTGTWHGYPKP